MTHASRPEDVGRPDDALEAELSDEGVLVAPASGALGLYGDAAHEHGDGGRTPARRAARRFLHNPVGMVGLVVLLVMLLVAIFAPWLAPADPNDQASEALLGPSSDHWLGTDDLGRDTASRLMYGARVSVRVGVQTVGLALIVAIPIGLVAGYFGGRVDNVLLRVMDAVMSFPALILALVLAAVLGKGLGNAMLAITIVLIPSFVRIIRGQTLAIKEEAYTDASRLIGTSTPKILAKRIFPGVLSPLIVAASLVLGIALVAEAALSYLGLGVQPPDASWGNMLRRGYTFIYSDPFQIVPPGVAIALAVIAFNTVGDSLRDALGLAETAPPKGAGRRRLGITGVARSAASPTPSAAVGTDVVSTSSTTSSTGANAPTASDDAAPLLAVRDLTVQFATLDGTVTVVDDLSLDVARGEVVGIVGESGSGKSVTSLALMRLLPTPPALIAGGSALFEDRDLLALGANEMRDLRGNAISMVFQDPLSSLNPAFTVGDQLVEAVRLHQRVSKSAARARALELLSVVDIPDPVSRMSEYPHRLSGGMRQRVLIAMALANEPKLLIADEPTTALDVTVQAQILDLLRDLQRELDMAMIFVTHDLGVVADICDRVVVMYAGQVVEQATVHDLFHQPKHPYTERLMAAIPQATPVGERLASIPGVVPVPSAWTATCRFSSRCPHEQPRCTERPVELTPLDRGRDVRCVRHEELELDGQEVPGA